MQDGVRKNAQGETFTIELLMYEPSFERVNAPFVKNLKLLGIAATMRLVDPAQFERRVKSFDFDVTVSRYIMPNTPGWSCAPTGAPRRRTWTAARTSRASRIR